MEKRWQGYRPKIKVNRRGTFKSLRSVAAETIRSLSLRQILLLARTTDQTY